MSTLDKPLDFDITAGADGAFSLRMGDAQPEVIQAAPQVDTAQPVAETPPIVAEQEKILTPEEQIAVADKRYKDTQAEYTKNQMRLREVEKTLAERDLQIQQIIPHLQNYNVLIQEMQKNQTPSEPEDLASLPPEEQKQYFKKLVAEGVALAVPAVLQQNPVYLASQKEAALGKQLNEFMRAHNYLAEDGRTPIPEFQKLAPYMKQVFDKFREDHPHKDLGFEEAHTMAKMLAEKGQGSGEAANTKAPTPTGQTASTLAVSQAAIQEASRRNATPQTVSGAATGKPRTMDEMVESLAGEFFHDPNGFVKKYR